MRTVKTSKRGCGDRKKGGLYIVSEPSENGVLPLWVSIKPPVPCADRFHRGPVLVDGDLLLSRVDEESWFVGTSADHREKLQADKWSLDRFGMTTTMRLRIGECAGFRGVDEAMQHLLESVRWNSVHVRDALIGLTDAQISEIPRVVEDYAQLIQNLQYFKKENIAMFLVFAAADIWRIADSTPPRYRKDILPHLMRLLVVLGLPKDGLAMRKRYLDE